MKISLMFLCDKLKWKMELVDSDILRRPPREAHHVWECFVDTRLVREQPRVLRNYNV